MCVGACVWQILKGMTLDSFDFLLEKIINFDFILICLTL